MLLGHTAIATTAGLYAHTLDDQKAAAAERLDAICEQAERRPAVNAQNGT